MNKLSIKILILSLLAITWFCTYYQGIATAISIWSISEIFNHCFLVIPGAFYLIYRKRAQLFQHDFVANYWLLFPLVGTLVLYTFGYVGDIRLFMHVATFVSLPLLIWLVIGNNAAKTIAFPLFFILFSIPFGEQLIPYLQEITTDLAVPLLELTGIPVYRNGLYLDIPEGRFLVAEACSGVSFLISSIVFGHLYAYLSFNSLTKRIAFIIISIILPVIANAIRVYGIILIAHLTDMEHAAGADHLIYGGVFFAIVLFLLIMIGERLRDKPEPIDTKINEDNNVVKITADIKVKPMVVVICIFVLQHFWLSTIISSKHSPKESVIMVDFTAGSGTLYEKQLTKWQPYFSTASTIQQGVLQSPDSVESPDIFIATYSGGEGELVSAVNKLFSADRWTLINNTTVQLDQDTKVKLIKIVSPTGQYRYILYWYQFANEVFTNKVKLKLYQTFMVMFGQEESSAIIALSIESDQKMEVVTALLKENVDMIKTSIKGSSL